MRPSLVSLVFLAMSLYAISPHPALGEEERTCIWRGKAPFCHGTCPGGWEAGRRDEQGPADAKKCVTGTKVHCCFVEITETFGTAPACAGKCPQGWTQQGDSDVGENGQKCLTGHAAICTKDVN
jgi:hypothetical protein